jgi:hypothetical protein
MAAAAEDPSPTECPSPGAGAEVPPAAAELSVAASIPPVSATGWSVRAGKAGRVAPLSWCDVASTRGVSKTAAGMVLVLAVFVGDSHKGPLNNQGKPA